MLEYSELTEILENLDADVCASGCHGFLCGQVCVSEFPAEEFWQEFIDARSSDDHRVDACYSEIRLLLTEIMEKISSPDLEFQLLLPDDDTPVQERVNALAEWCHGFLNGYGSGAANLEKSLTDESREVLEDFTRICRVDVNENTNEEDEKALMELVEYVRIGTLMIYDDLVSGSGYTADPGVLH